MLVLEDIGRSTNGKILWRCECDCGNDTVVISSNLLNGFTKSCGCLQQQRAAENHKIDLSNCHIGNFTIVKEIPNMRYADGSIMWDCIRDFCGEHKILPSITILHSIPYSCGCININSKGERQINELLKKAQISFIPQYSFKDCINPNTGKKLFFDFYLPDYTCCIEYDGIQHYRISGWNTKEEYKNIVYRDNLKNDYCNKNNISLIRIPYTDFDKINIDYLKEKIYNILK